MHWRQFPWHPCLQWVFRLRSLPPDHFAFLKQLNRGLVEGWFEQPECFKYRSLQLTGDEKRLETLVKGTLFAPGCLTLEMLGCLPETLPLAAEQLSSGAEHASLRERRLLHAGTEHSCRFGTTYVRATGLGCGDPDSQGSRVSFP